MRALIDLAVAETNTAFDLSSINGYFNLVYAYGDYDHDDSGDVELSLQQLTSTSDGTLDGVHALREEYGADAVSMIMNVGNFFCGRAFYGYPQPSANVMFSAIAWGCATGYYSFGHELGHNFVSSSV